MAALETFLDEVGQRWQPASRHLLRDTSRLILIHLRRRLPPEETRHLFAQLPQDINDFAKTRDIELREELGDKPLEIFSAETFYETLEHETHAPRDAMVEATRAVFSVLKDRLPANEARHAQEMLPEGLKQEWASA